MKENKKFNIIKNIEPDAPFSSINWCSISFLTPNKFTQFDKRDDKPTEFKMCKHIDVYGFKIHNGYNSLDIAELDAKAIKDKNDNHDVYLSQLGQLYSWDDITKSDSIAYDDEELNDLEKTRRENIDKKKLIANEIRSDRAHNIAPNDKMISIQNRMRKNLYDKGLITKEEFDLVQIEQKPIKEIKNIVLEVTQMNKEIEIHKNTDYLDENDPIGLKYGCITFYSPKHIGGLKTLCFKVRGMFQTQNEMSKRAKKLQRLYSMDRIYTFEVGKWCPFSENDNLTHSVLLDRLNYAMKLHLDNVNIENKEYDERKEKLKSKTEQENKPIKQKSRRAKRQAKHKAAAAISSKAGSISDSQCANGTNGTSSTSETNNSTKIPDSSDPFVSFGNIEDDEAANKIFNYLDDPELRNKYAADQSKLQKMTMDVNN